jgi:hypothetical protein
MQAVLLSFYALRLRMIGTPDDAIREIARMQAENGGFGGL